MNTKEFFAKMDCEGGPNELANYGLKPTDIDDPEIRDLWQSYLDKHRELEPLSDKLLELMEEHCYS